MNGSSTVEINHLTQFELKFEPSESITSLKFVPDNSGSSDHIIITTFDGTITLFNVSNNSISSTFRNLNDDTLNNNIEGDDEMCPVLTCVVKDVSSVYFGDADNYVKMVDMNKETKVSMLGSHEACVGCIGYSQTSSQVVSGSWDAYIKTFDPRISRETGSYLQIQDVFYMDVKDQLVAASLAENYVCIWDLRRMKDPLRLRVSNVPKYRPRCITITSDKKDYLLGTVSGRVSKEHITDEKKNEYVFYNRGPGGLNEDYAVNSILFQEGTSKFVTGGSCYFVRLFDLAKSRHRATYSRYPNQISAMDFSSDGESLAVGCSYIHDHVLPPSRSCVKAIFIRDMNHAFALE